MLFSLKFVEKHPIYKMNQDVISFFYLAFKNKGFGDHLFTKELLHVINLSQEDRLRKIFQEVYIALNNERVEHKLFIDFIEKNNSISILCVNPERKISLNHDYIDLIENLKVLYSYLWSSTLNTQGFRNSYGDIDDHYSQFFQLNCRPYNLCPFCGIEKYLNPKIKRNDYDHYLCQKHYPELSINFYNLVPMPNYCNSADNKGSNDLLFDKVKHILRKAYYPYHPIENIVISVDCSDMFGQNQAWAVVVSKKGNNQNEAFDTWKNVFHIERRWAIEIEEKFTYWIQNFANEYKKNSPRTILEISTIIPQYIDKIKGRAKEPGYFLEIEFWNYILTKDDVKELIIYYIHSVLKFEEAA